MDKDPPAFSRPDLEDPANAVRRFGGFYRSPDRERGGKRHGGTPLTTVEAAAVEAIRTGYRVAAAQVDRSARVANRLRKAADDSVGEGGERHAVDAVERLVLKSLLAGSAWMETIAAESGSPIKRLLEAEYRLLGSLFGIALPVQKKSRKEKHKEDPTETQDDQPEDGRVVPVVSVVHEQGSARRAVRIKALEFTAKRMPGRYRVDFFAQDARAVRSMGADFVVAPGAAPVLRVKTAGKMPSGRWMGAICTEDGTQLGFMEIEL